MDYNDLTLHQKISLKGIFTSKKERRDLGLKDEEVSYSYLQAIWLLWDFKKAINYFLNGDIDQ